MDIQLNYKIGNLKVKETTCQNCWAKTKMYYVGSASGKKYVRCDKCKQIFIK